MGGKRLDFSNLTYEDFRVLAGDPSLSRYEKIGFPDGYRKGREEEIFKDILSKVANIKEEGAIILDIGPGCSDLPRMLIDNARKHNQRILLVDSPEMLELLPSEAFIEKFKGPFPGCAGLFNKYKEHVDAIIVYSVFQYVFSDGNPWSFLDKALSLLSPQGKLLIGDIPNNSMRKRFFCSEAGTEAHKQFTGKDEPPSVKHFCLEEGVIDDAVMMGVVLRARLQGYNAYIMPQRKELPMANRREDILIERL